ncbi:DUF3800 domain-containing protein [Parachryseolinea silvisoli]|uniref:DUF3800 domain-containing protein n=1 Tax=Parachryseolinea silvisoli TaxID=2873601 RepID=UPI002265EF7D|nr:DUF3800 domain-containing protein [Parachryseolinea silvisoli]MCD9017521.1 DUF3800 domain-containing protein [Parachryseolinea silvisoli]
MPINVYFDEAGNTGDNLLDVNQPVYALMSCSFQHERADELLSRIKCQADEVHFKSIRKSRSNQLQILQILNDDAISEASVRYSVSDKEFALTAHIVDRLIEPVLYHDMNHDGYGSGLNAHLANSLYVIGKFGWGQERFAKMLFAFLLMVKTKTNESIANFYTVMHDEYKISDDATRGLLDLIMSSMRHIRDILSHLDKFDLDLALTSFVILCNQWGETVEEPFNVFHDDSKQIEFSKHYLEFLSSKKIEPAVVGFEGDTLKFPFLIRELSLVNSKEVKQVQLADILASSVRHAVTEIYIKKSEDRFAREILETRLMHLFHHSIFPDFNSKMPDMTQKKGENILDYLANLACKHEEAQLNRKSGESN